MGARPALVCLKDAVPVLRRRVDLVDRALRSRCSHIAARNATPSRGLETAPKVAATGRRTASTTLDDTPYRLRVLS
jgi:hypothetical protein